MTHQIYIGTNKATFQEKEIKGELITFDNETYYKISNSDQMRPFFISLISDSNHWMFIASNGGLSAGRKNSDNALFPYYTDDKITESNENTGSKTLIKIVQDQKHLLWEPFSSKYEGIYDIERNLYKNEYGNKIVFEEYNKDVGLCYRYQWNTSDRYGFVKKATIINHLHAPCKVTILDGLQNIIPSSVGEDLQKASSNLVDAYKRNELVANAGLGIFALSATIVDKAEPSESLRSTIVWSLGLPQPTYLVSALQLDAFRKGTPITQESDIKAERGAYFACSNLEIASNSGREWMQIADINQNINDITAICKQIKETPNLMELVQKDIELGTQKLLKLASAADAMQYTADDLRNARHFSNTMFNIMRGGIFDHNYQVEKWDFQAYMAKANKEVFTRMKNTIDTLPEVFTISELMKQASQSNNLHFKRLCFEYMPLKFSRRHGDPSRPWNKFSINTRSEVDGSKVLDYQGNWRDIFQNWEALAISYPEFIENMIHKFLNATTFEGYNPYRITKDGFDWETIEEDDPWSYIGYWGDHQIIYLQKFLEIIENHYPGKLANYFKEAIFVYANVPYKIKSYSDSLKNPKDTIDFDFELDQAINQRREQIGVDGALLQDANGAIYGVNFIEKMLATLLAKFSNFIPQGGIWLNTQRPEWNDANNALVGNGVSMVTLYYMRRFLHFFKGILTAAPEEESSISEELYTFYQAIATTLTNHKALLEETISDIDRKKILDGLAIPASNYRGQIYQKGFSGKKKSLSLEQLSDTIATMLAFVDHTIDTNKREDNLYHAYNLMTVKGDHQIEISHLEEMLEGQVAVLSSGYLTARENLAVLDALKQSALFRDDQYSYLLYPNKELPKFLEKNTIPKEAVQKSKLMQALLDDESVAMIRQDVNGDYHFNGSFNNANILAKSLDQLDASTYGQLLKEERSIVLEIYEEVFNHKAFTGRSGTFFGYEGLGSIYWHMVSKLLLATQECCLSAIHENEDDEVIGRLLEHYYEINEGIGVHKSPKLYGAFPTDPYSHTPGGKGAQQPGMTGQVKEDILSRFGELGVFVSQGQITFRPSMLRKAEFLVTSQSIAFTHVNSKVASLEIPKDALCFSYCQVPIVYILDTQEGLEVVHKNGKTESFEELRLNEKMSTSIFKRKGEVAQIRVKIKPERLK